MWLITAFGPDAEGVTMRVARFGWQLYFPKANPDEIPIAWQPLGHSTSEDSWRAAPQLTGVGDAAPLTKLTVMVKVWFAFATLTEATVALRSNDARIVSNVCPAVFQDFYRWA